MANSDRPRGFDLYGKVLRCTNYMAGSTIYPGDAVILSSDGMIDRCAASGAYTSFLLGVAANKATVGEQCAVYDHPDQLYVVQADESDVDAQTDIHMNFAVVATAADTTFDTSRMELDSSSVATTNTLPLKLLKILPRANNALGANVDCVVRINNNQLTADAGSLGV